MATKAKVVAVKKDEGKKMPPWMKGKGEEKPAPKKGK